MLISLPQLIVTDMDKQKAASVYDTVCSRMIWRLFGVTITLLMTCSRLHVETLSPDELSQMFVTNRNTDKRARLLKNFFRSL